MGLGWLFAEHALYCGGRDAMDLGDLPDALATLAVLLDGDVVQHRPSSDRGLAVWPCAADLVCVLGDDLVAALSSHLAEVE